MPALFKQMPRGYKRGLGPGFISMVLAIVLFLVVWKVFDGYKPYPVHAADTSFTLLSNAFEYGERIPDKYTFCDGEDVSPALSWQNPPEGTKSYVLICEDPDAPAGLWIHWVLYDLSPDLAGLAEGMPKDSLVLGSAKNGKNSWPEGRLGYDGPCPPPGKPHRYFFYLYALSEPINLEPGLVKDDVVSAMEGKVLGKAELMGTYSR